MITLDRRELLRAGAFGLGLLATGKAFSFVKRHPRVTFITSHGDIECQLVERESGIWTARIESYIDYLYTPFPVVFDAMGALRPEFSRLHEGKPVMMMRGDTISLTVKDPGGLL